jgi:prolyl oligopeptidase
VIETMHGVSVPDPFRRLESAEDPETVAWVAGQNARTRALLDSPLRDRLVARLRELHRVPRMSVPAVRGERIFFTESDGVRAQPILYADHVGADLRVPPSHGFGEARQSAQRDGGRPGPTRGSAPTGRVA